MLVIYQMGKFLGSARLRGKHTIAVTLQAMLILYICMTFKAPALTYDRHVTSLYNMHLINIILIMIYTELLKCLVEDFKVNIVTS